MSFTNDKIKLTECPRDAMQGIKFFIPTNQKAEYINSLLKVGFDIIDFGSFVSPKAVPQMKDTSELVKLLDLTNSKSKLLAIIANEKGVIIASDFDEINFLGFPFSISETFQINNTNSTIKESLLKLESIIRIGSNRKKEIIAYLSMGFGNPYNDEWNLDIVINWVRKLSEIGIRLIALSDTIGVSNESTISKVFNALISEYPDIEFSAHFHTHSNKWLEKVESAFNSGCRSFDGSIGGIGGCPMTGFELVGNMPMDRMVDYFNQRRMINHIDVGKFEEARINAINLFSKNQQIL